MPRMFPAAANAGADRRDGVVAAVWRGLVRPASFPTCSEPERLAGDTGELARWGEEVFSEALFRVKARGRAFSFFGDAPPKLAVVRIRVCSGGFRPPSIRAATPMAH